MHAGAPAVLRAFDTQDLLLPGPGHGTSYKVFSSGHQRDREFSYTAQDLVCGLSFTQISIEYLVIEEAC
jgi:hypothetical protein